MANTIELLYDLVDKESAKEGALAELSKRMEVELQSLLIDMQTVGQLIVQADESDAFEINGMVGYVVSNMGEHGESLHQAKGYIDDYLKKQGVNNHE